MICFYKNDQSLVSLSFPPFWSSAAGKKVNLVSDQDLQKIKEDEDRKMQSMTEEEIMNYSRNITIETTPSKQTRSDDIFNVTSPR